MTKKTYSFFAKGLFILTGGILCFLAMLASAIDSATVAGRCDLETRIIGRTQSTEQGASQILESLEKSPDELVDMPVGLGSDVRFFLIHIGDRNRPVLVNVGQGRQSGYTLYIDTTGNGKLSDEKPFPARAVRSGWFGNDRYRFGPIAIDLDHEGVKTTASFHISTTEADVLGVYPFQCLRGEVVLAGKTYVVTVIDGNLDGRYEIRPFAGNVGPSGLDSIAVLSNESVSIEQRYTGLVPLTETVRIDDSYFEIEMNPGGEFIVFREAQMDYGTLAIQDANVRMRLWSTQAGQFLSGKGSWKLPVADYRILQLELVENDGSGGFWTLSESGSASSFKSFQIHKDQTTKLPITSDIQVQTYVSKGSDPTVRNIGFYYIGSGGQRYASAMFRNGVRQPPPGIRILDESGKVLTTGRLKYG